MSKISKQIKKNDFIIWRYEDGPIRVEETNTFLKTYTHRCEPPVREAWQSVFEIASSLRSPSHFPKK